MQVTILGSGTVDPQPHRACSGYFLELGEERFLCDLGNASLRRAVEHQRPVSQVSRLFLSHLHPDHTADLVPFLFARNYAPPPWGDHPKLTIHGPKGTRNFLQALYTAWPSICPKEGKPVVEVLEMSGERSTILQGDDYSVEAVPVEHGDMEAYGFRFEEKGRVFAYSGDTKLCRGVEAVAESADLFLCECSCFPRGCEPLYCREVHLSWEDVAEICAQANPKRVILTHLYEPVLAARPNPLQSLQGALEAPVELAEDGAIYQV